MKSVPRSWHYSSILHSTPLPQLLHPHIRHPSFPAPLCFILPVPFPQTNYTFSCLHYCISRDLLKFRIATTCNLLRAPMLRRNKGKEVLGREGHFLVGLQLTFRFEGKRKKERGFNLQRTWYKD